jgi:predicted DNA-binding ribbon-helix-helix protein
MTPFWEKFRRHLGTMSQRTLIGAKVLMKSSIVKRSVVIGGHKTSISLEEPFWIDLKQIAHAQHVTLSALLAQIDDTREQSNLSSAIRVFVLRHFRRLYFRRLFPTAS